MRHPDGDRIIERLFKEAFDLLKAAGHPMGLSQMRRMSCALHFTLDSMAICDHPMEQRESVLLTVQTEMLAAMLRGEYVPECQTELFWDQKERATVRERTMQWQITRGNKE